MSAPLPSSPGLPPAKRMRSRSPEQAASASTSATAPSSSSAQDKQARKADARRSRQKRKDYAKQLTKTGREPIEFDIEDLIGARKVTDILSEGLEHQNKFERGTRLILQIERLDAHGDGLAIAPERDWIIAVPHTLPGEKVTVEITSNERLYSKAKLVEVLEKSSVRQDELVRCKYFGDCGGCQYQMIDYAQQLEIKRGVVERAFARFSGLDSALIPQVLPTIASPNQYNYRTKLTPHFELPYELRRGRRTGVRNDANSNANGAEQKRSHSIQFPSALTASAQNESWISKSVLLRPRRSTRRFLQQSRKSETPSSLSRTVRRSFSETRCGRTTALPRTSSSRLLPTEKWRRTSTQRSSQTTRQRSRSAS